MKLEKLLQAAAMTACALLLTINVAHAAREMLADRGCANYEFDGQCWFAPEPTLSIRLNSFFIPLDFDGTGAPAFRDITLDPRGRADFSTGDFFAPLFASAPFKVNPDFLSTIEITTGNIAPVVIDSSRPITYDPLVPSTYDPSQDLNAVRFWFDSVCTATGPCDNTGRGAVSFQALLIGLGNDSFLLQYNYGFNGTNVPPGATAAYSLGGNAAPYGGPYDQSLPFDAANYCFNHGAVSVFTTIDACTNAVTTDVPEPVSTSLVLLGLGLLVAFETRRRRSAPAFVAA